MNARANMFDFWVPKILAKILAINDIIDATRMFFVFVHLLCWIVCASVVYLCIYYIGVLLCDLQVCVVISSAPICYVICRNRGKEERDHSCQNKPKIKGTIHVKI